MHSRILYLVVSLLIFAQLSQQKVFTESITLTKFKREGGFHYITKMAMDLGSGSWSAHLRFNKRINVPKDLGKYMKPELKIFLDDEWNSLDPNDSCVDKVKEQRTHRSKKNIKIPTDGKWSQSISGTLSQSRKRRIWYFVLTECDMNKLQATIDENRYAGIKLEIELRLYNNKSHFSSDEKGFIWPLLFLLIVTALTAAYGAMHFTKNYKKGDGFDWTLFLILMGILFQAGFLLFEFIHQSVYAQNGKGIFVLNLFGEMSEVLSQFTFSCFLLLVSWGWSINYMELDSFDLLIPLAILVGVIHVMIMGLGKLTDNAHYKHHQYDGWPGYLVLAIRIGLFIYFLYGIKDIQKKANNKLKQFVSQLKIFGSLYFLAFPILLIVSWFIAPYVRNIVITIGTLIIQTITFMVLTYLSTNKKSAYYSVSLKNQTILPSNKGF